MRPQTRVATPFRTAFAVLLLYTTAVRAQAPTPSTPPAPEIDAIGSKIAGLHEREGRLHAIGSDYKATLDATGMELTPALGPAADRNLPLRWQPRSVTRGGTTVWDANAPRTAPQRTADRRAERDLAFGIAERFDVRPDGVEVSYVFEQPVAGRGDLVVHVEFDTELSPAPGATEDGGLDYFAAGVGGVHIGGVTGIDAAGRTARGSLRPTASGIDLVLPAAFVDTASWPLVLDPLVGTYRVLTSTHNDRHPDVAYDASNDVYLVVFERRFSVVDVDVLGQRLDPQGMPVGSAITIAFGPSIQNRPRVASVNCRNRFLVVWQYADYPTGPWRVRGRAVDAANGAVNSATIPMSPPSDNAQHPDVGGNRSTGFDQCIVVWENVGAGSIDAAVVRMPATGAPTVPAQTTISTSSTGGGLPAISESSGDGPFWCVAWSRFSLLSESVYARAVNRSATPLGNPLLLGSGGSPDVDGDGSRFVVAWELYDSTFSERDVYARSVTATSNGVLSTASATHSVAGTSGVDEWDAVVAYCDAKYLVLWTDIATGLNTQVRGLAFDGRCRPCGRTLRMNGASNVRDHQPAVASQWAAGEDSHAALIAFADHSTTPPFTGDLITERYEALRGGTVVQVAVGCGSAGIAEASGPPAIGNPDFKLTLRNADPASAFSILSASLRAPPPVTCGTCQLLGGESLWFVPLAGGRAELPLPIPCFTNFAGVTLDFQWVEFGSSSSPCPLAATLSASNWMRATLAF